MQTHINMTGKNYTKAGTIKIKKIKSDDQSQLLPLTEQDKEYVSRKRKSEIFNNVLIIIMFFCASIVFITFAFK